MNTCGAHRKYFLRLKQLLEPGRRHSIRFWMCLIHDCLECYFISKNHKFWKLKILYIFEMDILLNMNSKELGRLRDELERQKAAHQVCQISKGLHFMIFIKTTILIHLLLICWLKCLSSGWSSTTIKRSLHLCHHVISKVSSDKKIQYASYSDNKRIFIHDI